MTGCWLIGRLSVSILGASYSYDWLFRARENFLRLVRRCWAVFGSAATLIACRRLASWVFVTTFSIASHRSRWPIVRIRVWSWSWAGVIWGKHRSWSYPIKFSWINLETYQNCKDLVRLVDLSVRRLYDESLVLAIDFDCGTYFFRVPFVLLIKNCGTLFRTKLVLLTVLPFLSKSSAFLCKLAPLQL